MVNAGEAADLGCGQGLLVAQLARRAPRLTITGVDLSDEMLSAARRTAAQAGLESRVVFKKADVRHLPFIDGSVDLVVSTWSLHHWRDPVAVLDDVSRVLRRPDPKRRLPGGAFLIFDLRRDLAAPGLRLLSFATNVVVPEALRLINEPMASRDAAYTPHEAVQLAASSRLTAWRVTSGPLWLTIEGRVKTMPRGVRVEPSPSTARAPRLAPLPRGSEQPTA
jgi:ubiquinone/menaquinone biosynthesis C-methylase UbiE